MPSSDFSVSVETVESAGSALGTAAGARAATLQAGISGSADDLGAGLALLAGLGAWGSLAMDAWIAAFDACCLLTDSVALLTAAVEARRLRPVGTEGCAVTGTA
jgi:hypothetical protein